MSWIVVFKGATRCSMSVLLLETQLGDSGQGFNEFFGVPKYVGRSPEQPAVKKKKRKQMFFIKLLRLMGS